MRISVLFLLLSASFLIQAQPTLQLLKKIGVGSPNVGTGVSQTFRGDVLGDGNLYFLASEDGLDNSYWKSDGTPANTVKVMDEPGYNDWNATYFISEGILTQDVSVGNKLKLYDVSSQQNIELGDLGTSDLRQLIDVGNGYMIRASDDDTEMASLWFTDLTAAGTKKLGTVGEDQTFLTLTASAYGAVVFNTNGFVADVPMYYRASTDEILVLSDYFANFAPITEVKHAYIYDKYMFLQVVEGGFQKNYTFDMVTETFYPFQFIREVFDYFPYGNDVFIVTHSEIVKFNTTDYSFTEVFGDVFAFTPILVKDNYIYLIGKGFNPDEEIYRIDMATDAVYKLPDSKTGNSYYTSQMSIYNGEFYYLGRNGSSQFLNKYDFNNEQTIVVDTCAVENGNLTITHGMKVVNDQLIVSKYYQALGHELHYLGTAPPNAVANLNVESIKVHPTVTSDLLFFAGELSFQNANVQIYDGQGRKLLKSNLQSSTLDVSELMNGMYYGILEEDGKEYSFRFVKG